MVEAIGNVSRTTSSFTDFSGENISLGQTNVRIAVAALRTQRLGSETSPWSYNYGLGIGYARFEATGNTPARPRLEHAPSVFAAGGLNYSFRKVPLELSLDARVGPTFTYDNNRLGTRIDALAVPPVSIGLRYRF